MSTTTASAAKPTHYKEVYFNHATLRKVTGNPTYYDPHYIYKQVKANFVFVPSTFGGARHGHLGLVTDTITYAHISTGNPSVCPVQPFALGENNTGTAAKIAENIWTHNLAITHFHQSNHIDHTIINQIQESLIWNFLISDENFHVLDFQCMEKCSVLYYPYGYYCNKITFIVRLYVI